MANHKRGRPKHQRAGCLMCKPHKDERVAKGPRPGSLASRVLQESVSSIVPVTHDDFKAEDDADEVLEDELWYAWQLDVICA